MSGFGFLFSLILLFYAHCGLQVSNDLTGSNIIFLSMNTRKFLTSESGSGLQF